MRIGGFVLIGVLLTASLANAQVVEADRTSSTGVGPFLIRGLIEDWDRELIYPHLKRAGLPAARTTTSVEVRWQRNVFLLLASLARAQSIEAQRRLSLDARTAWHAAYMSHVRRSISPVYPPLP